MSRNAMKLGPQGDREVVVERSFDAPRDLVFEGLHQARTGEALDAGT